uniref:Plastocyanin-like domain-containing protein n=1 Tax=Magallana gigas TaxID=29159 RepID=A0A8W8IT18_MAGGI
MGFGKYDRQSAKFIEETNDIRCTGLPTPNLCNKELWKPESWIRNPNSIPDIKLLHPPIKDTIIVPSGGYVIIRFKASNPGPWFLHSQVNLHTTYGMGMVLYVVAVMKSAICATKMIHGLENTVPFEVGFDESATCIRHQRSYILVTASHPHLKYIPPTNANEDGIAFTWFCGF